MLHQKALWVVVRADGVLKRATRYKASLRDIALSQDKLPCVGRHLVGVAVEVAVNRINLNALIDITRNGSVVIALLRQILVVVESRLVAEQKGTLHIPLNGFLVGSDGEEEFVKASNVFPRFDRAIVRGILAQGEHQTLALIEDINLFSLLLSKVERSIEGIATNTCTEQGKDHRVKTDLPKGGFDIL